MVSNGKKTPETGVADGNEVVKITVVLMLGGLRTQLLGDASAALRRKDAKWVKLKGLNGENEVHLYAPDVRLIEVTEGRVRRVEDAAAEREFKPVTF